MNILHFCDIFPLGLRLFLKVGSENKSGRKFEKDEETDAVLMIGEIGGPQEAEAAEYAKNNISKPIIAYIAGLTAPKGKRMGHAGAIVSSHGESAAEKVEILKKAGITIAKNPSVIGETVETVLKAL